MMSIPFFIAAGQFDQVIGQAEILLAAFIMKFAQPCAGKLLVTVAVPVNAPVLRRVRSDVRNDVEQCRK